MLSRQFIRQNSYPGWPAHFEKPLTLQSSNNLKLLQTHLQNTVGRVPEILFFDTANRDPN